MKTRRQTVLEAQRQSTRFGHEKDGRKSWWEASRMLWRDISCLQLFVGDDANDATDDDDDDDDDDEDDKDDDYDWYADGVGAIPVTCLWRPDRPCKTKNKEVHPPKGSPFN